MSDRDLLPDYKRSARPLRGHRGWLKYRTLGDMVDLRSPELIRECATSGHPMNLLICGKPSVRSCYCFQVCCEKPRPRFEEKPDA